MSVLPVGFGSSGGLQITNSVRLRAAASAYFSRTFGSPTGSTICTFSAWVKRGALGSYQSVFGAYAGVGNFADIEFLSNDTLGFYYTISGVSYSAITTAVFRDPSAHYHIVAYVDSNNATLGNRVRLYVNNVLQTFASNTIPQTAVTVLNTAEAHSLGRFGNASQYTDGYLSDVYFIDGQALTPSNFGETNADGVWVPKVYTGTYGTNGFHLDFKDPRANPGGNAGFGKDVSGNGNVWTSSSISETAGVTYDSMVDTPTNNWCTLNSLKQASSIALSEANLRAVSSAGTARVHSTQLITTPTYFEFNWISGGRPTPGVATPSGDNTTITGDATTDATLWEFFTYNGNKMNGSNVAYGSAAVAGDLIGVAVNPVTGKIWWAINNVWQASGDPAAGTNAAFTNIPITGVIPCVGSQATGWDGSINFGQAPLRTSATYDSASGGYFRYTPPTGFKALCTANLPPVAITKPTDHHSVHTVTKSGDTAFTLPWNADTYDTLFEIKRRDSAGAWYRLDGVRGYTKVLFCDTTAAETTDANVLGVSGTTCTLKSTLTDGTYVIRAWKAGLSASRSTNTNGSMTTTVSNNATAGFSICTYTSPNNVADQTFGHGLGLVPEFAEIKNLDSANNWDIFHTSQGYNATFIYTTAGTRSGALGSTINTTIFTTKTGFTHNSTNRYVAYAWAEIAGYSAFNQYVGNGVADGPFQWLGFRPASQVVKYSGAERFLQIDAKRDTYNVQQNVLSPNATTSEGTGLLNTDATAGAIKVRSAVYGNTGSGNHIVAAFAEFPFGGSNCSPSPAR